MIKRVVRNINFASSSENPNSKWDPSQYKFDDSNYNYDSYEVASFEAEQNAYLSMCALANLTSNILPNVGHITMGQVQNVDLEDVKTNKACLAGMGSVIESTVKKMGAAINARYKAEMENASLYGGDGIGIDDYAAYLRGLANGSTGDILRGLTNDAGPGKDNFGGVFDDFTDDGKRLIFDPDNFTYYFVEEMTPEEIEAFCNGTGVNNADAPADYAANHFYKCTINVNGIEVPINFVSQDFDQMSYIINDLSKFQDSFETLPPSSLRDIVNANTNIVIASDTRCAYKDSYGGFNWKWGDANTVFYQDFEYDENGDKIWYDPFNYSFAHETGHAFDYSASDGSYSDADKLKLIELFNKYCGSVEIRDDAVGTGFNYFYEPEERVYENMNAGIIETLDEGRYHELFAEAYRYYVQKPELMQTEAPELYEYMNSFFRYIFEDIHL